MPQAGIGIMPPAGAVFNELEYTIRRAFLPNVIVQIYKSSPVTCALLGSALMATGGVSPITAPVQGNTMVSVQRTDYSGKFNNPGVIPGIQNAEFDLAGYVATLPFPGMEGLVELDYAVVPLIEARMNDATNKSIDVFSTDLWNNITNPLGIIGLPAAIDDGTNAASYGGILRNTTNSDGTAWWQSSVVSNSAGAVTPTRDLISQYIMQVFKKNGEMPKMGVMGPGTWLALQRDFTPLERYNTGPGDQAYGDNTVRALFKSLEVSGVPIYLDPYAPEGTLYLLNTDYLSLYLHEKAAFKMLGFESTLANGQIGYIGAILTLMQLVNVKPQSQGRFSNLAYVSI